MVDEVSQVSQNVSILDYGTLVWAVIGLSITVGSLGIYIARIYSKHSEREMQHSIEKDKKNDDHAKKIEELLRLVLNNSSEMVKSVDNNTNIVDNNLKVMLKVIDKI
jgi:PAS domain-containing protein